MLHKRQPRFSSRLGLAITFLGISILRKQRYSAQNFQSCQHLDKNYIRSDINQILTLSKVPLHDKLPELLVQYAAWRLAIKFLMMETSFQPMKPLGYQIGTNCPISWHLTWCLMTPALSEESSLRSPHNGTAWGDWLVLSVSSYFCFLIAKR